MLKLISHLMCCEVSIKFLLNIFIFLRHELKATIDSTVILLYLLSYQF